MSILAALLCLAASCHPAATPHDPDTVFARADRTAGEVVRLHEAALARARAPADGLRADEVEVLGISHVGGEPAYKLKVHHGCDVEDLWLDFTSFVELKRSDAGAATAAAAHCSDSARGAGG